MASKIGIHVNFVSRADQMFRFVREAKPALVVTVHHDGAFFSRLKAEVPEIFLVGRKYNDRQPLDKPKEEAYDLFRWIRDASLAHVCDAWVGYNETPRDKRERLYEFDYWMAYYLHQEGIKYAARSWSVGVPDIPDWMEEDSLDSLRVADYIAVHEYCAPRMDDPRGLDSGQPGTGWFTLRYRKWYPNLPSDCQKPLLITECGIDSGACHWDPGVQGGWRSFTYAADYIDQLKWYDQYLQADPYVKGAAIFCCGNLDPKFRTYDVAGDDMLWSLSDYITSQAGEPIPPSPEPIPDWEARALMAEAKLDQIRLIVTK